MLAGPCNGSIEIGQHLPVRNLAHHLLDQLGHFGITRGIALAEIEFGCNGHIAMLRQAAAYIADVLVYPKDFLHHQDHRRPLPARRHRAIARQYVLARRYLNNTCIQACIIGVNDGVCPDGPGGQGKPAGQRTSHKAAAVQPERRAKAVEIGTKIG
jgi:hypothetical protein